MKKNTLNLTDEKKIEFLAKFDFYQLNLKIKNIECKQGVRNVLSIISSILSMSLCALCMAFLSPVTILFAITFVLSWGISLYSIHIPPKAMLNCLLLQHSDNKINYDIYKELEFSGQIDKWREQFKNQLLQYDYSSLETSVYDYVSIKKYQQRPSHNNKNSKMVKTQTKSITREENNIK